MINFRCWKVRRCRATGSCWAFPSSSLPTISSGLPNLLESRLPGWTLNKGKSSIFNIRSTSSNPGCQGEQLQHLQQQHHISTATAECYQQQPPRFTQTRIAGMNIEQREQHVYNRIRTDLVRTRGATAIIGTCLPQADFQKEQRTTMTNLTISPSQSAIWKKRKLSWMTSYSFSTS